MLESAMEDLIAKFPKDFFPRKVMTLIGRQGSFSGVGRYDLLFKDEHQTNILMELKARPAKYEDASQLAKYNDALKEQGRNDIIMWLVATIIPSSVREFLDRIGIEYTEIHESEYRTVAIRNNVIIKSENELLVNDNIIPGGLIKKKLNRSFNDSSHSFKTKNQNTIGTSALEERHDRMYSRRGRIIELIKINKSDQYILDVLDKEFPPGVFSTSNKQALYGTKRDLRI